MAEPDPAGAFYDDLAPDYHLLFADWSAAIAAQAAALDALIGAARVDLLDCACGIGTQAIGLAGYAVTWHPPEETGYGQHLLLGRPTG